jgi:hypothetical protein
MSSGRDVQRIEGERETARLKAATRAEKHARVLVLLAEGLDYATIASRVRMSATAVGDVARTAGVQS